ncbi:MAG: tyrosine-type recombinase/integrase [Ottowia sp.]|nr:tyrosine-type recombinase/integrase [Ottowia sp.]
MTTTTITPVSNLTDVLTTIENNLSPNTRDAYQQELTTLTEQFAANGWELYPLNKDGSLNPSLYLTQILSYLQQRADAGLTVSTINKTLCAVKWDASRTSPHAVGLLSMKQVSAFMTGLTRTRRGDTVRKASALNTDQLTTLYKHLRRNRTVRNVRDKALIALGIATALRASNIADLKLKDLTPTLTYDGFLVKVRWSKTDQSGAGFIVPVKASENRLVDPITATREWLTILSALGYTQETHPDFPLFPVLRQNTVKEQEIAHPAITLTKLVRDRLTEAGIATKETVKQYSSHSLRSTFITLSSQAGVSEKHIATVSGHKSMTVLRSYDRTSLEQFAQTDYLTPQQ